MAEEETLAPSSSLRPILIRSLLKDQCKHFLRDNEVAFDSTATKEQLEVLIRQTLSEAGINPEFFDFGTRKELLHAGVGAGPTKLGSSGQSGSSACNLPPPDPFDLEPQSSAATRWANWIVRYRIYEQACELKEKTVAVQRSHFLCCAGRAVMDLVLGLQEDEGELDELKRVQDALEAYFRPKKNKHFERQQLRKLEQRDGEPIDAFVARLRQQAKYCEYAVGETDERLLEQIVEKCKSDELRKRLLEKGNELNLQKALESARAFESVSLQSRALKQSVCLDGQIAALNHGSSSGSVNNRRCHYCAQDHEMKAALCPAFGKKCGKCGGKNHFAAACLKPSQTPRPGKKPGKKVRVVQEDEEHNSSDSDGGEHPLYVSKLTTKQAQSLYIVLEVSGRSLKFLLDTGASCQCLPRSAVPSGAILEACGGVYQYDGTSVPVVGKVVLPVKNSRTGKRYNVLFTVLEKGTPILGLNAILKMKLMKVTSPQLFHLQRSSRGKKCCDELLQRTVEVFCDKIGKRKGVKGKLSRREEVEPD